MAMAASSSITRHPTGLAIHQARRPSPVYSLKLIPATLSNLLHLSTITTTTTTKPSFLNNKNNITFFPPLSNSADSPSSGDDISSLRSALHGEADWSHLLHPLHPALRRELVKYGELAQATYAAFDHDCGACRFHSPGRLLPSLGLSRHGYHVTAYLNATSHAALPRWLAHSFHADAWARGGSSWMGFVAVSGDAESRRLGCRDVAVAWRGTVSPAEWVEDIQGLPEPLLPGGGDAARVEHGFHSIYTAKAELTRTSASEQVMGELTRLVQLYTKRGEKVTITITGHSLGGALALLCADEVAATMPNVPVTVVSFGAPRVGNKAFGERLSAAGVKVLRAVVKQDVVPKVPGIVYTHVGTELGLDVRASPHLKRGLDLAGCHSLETYLHLVDGYVGDGEGFRVEARRDVRLVNKGCGTFNYSLL